MCNSTHPPCFEVVVFEHNKQIQAYSPPHRALFQSEKCSFFEHYQIKNEKKFQNLNDNYGRKAHNNRLKSIDKSKNTDYAAKRAKNTPITCILQAIGLCSYFER